MKKRKRSTNYAHSIRLGGELLCTVIRKKLLIRMKFNKGAHYHAYYRNVYSKEMYRVSATIRKYAKKGMHRMFWPKSGAIYFAAECLPHSKTYEDQARSAHHCNELYKLHTTRYAACWSLLPSFLDSRYSSSTCCHSLWAVRYGWHSDTKNLR